MVESIEEKVKGINRLKEVYDGMDTSIPDGFSGNTASAQMDIIDQLASVSPTEIAAIADAIAAVVAAVQNGERTQEEGQSLLQPYLDLIGAADQFLDVGNDISAEGLRLYPRHRYRQRVEPARARRQADAGRRRAHADHVPQ